MNIFTKHPNEVKMSYFQHMGYAFTVVGRLGVAATCCFIHAIFPFWCTTTASDMIDKLQKEFNSRDENE